MSTPNHSNKQNRAGNGKYTRTIDTAERDAEAARLKARGHSYQHIADALDYADRSGAYRAVQRALRETVQEPADELRKIELDRLDRLYEAAMDVLEREHIVISQGRVVKRNLGPKLDSSGIEVLDPLTGKTVYEYEEIRDDAPILAAIDRCQRLSESRRKLLGLDAPARAKVEVADGVDAEIERLVGELARLDGRGEAAAAGPSPG